MYMIETDMPACVVTCLGFMLIFRTKIGQNYAKQTDFVPLNPENLLPPLNNLKIFDFE